MRRHKIVLVRPGVYRIVDSDDPRSRRCSFAAGIWPILIIVGLMYALHWALVALSS